MNKAYYLEYNQIERSHWWFRVREKILISVLRRFVAHSPQILNVGAATGRSSEALGAFGQVVSLEFDGDCVEFVKQNTGLEIVQGSVLDLPYASNTFDLVCAFDVIEHVDDDQKAVNELIRVCKSGGFVMVSVPMYQMLWSAHDEVNQHFRRYTLSALSELFEAQSGKIVYKSYFNTLLFPFIALLRLVSKRKNENTSDFAHYSKSTLSNQIFHFIFGLELHLLKVIRFWYGVSGMLVFQKH